jgi:erythromycin esterase-like protein
MQLNFGQLRRERFDDQVALIGLGTHSGTVAAADDRDAMRLVKSVRPALPGS